MRPRTRQRRGAHMITHTVWIYKADETGANTKQREKTLEVCLLLSLGQSWIWLVVNYHTDTIRTTKFPLYVLQLTSNRRNSIL